MAVFQRVCELSEESDPAPSTKEMKSFCKERGKVSSKKDLLALAGFIFPSQLFQGFPSLCVQD